MSRSWVTYYQSANALSKSSATDADADGDTDTLWYETVVNLADGSRTETVEFRNQDNSVRSLTKSVLGADRITSETWQDLNQDGVFQTTDKFASVVINAATQERISTVSDRSANGTLLAQVIETTSADGLIVSKTVDADGDGDLDLTVTDVTVLNADLSSARTITNVNADLSQRAKSTITTSADGLTITSEFDLQGTIAVDKRQIEAVLKAADGSVTKSVSERSGDNSTLLSKVTVWESSDKQTSVQSSDFNGDGVTDVSVSTLKIANGSATVTKETFKPSGAVASRSVSSISGNGLTKTEVSDANANGVNETITTDTTILGLDGSRKRTVDVNNGDGTNRSTTEITLRDDGLKTTTRLDQDGNGVWERRTEETTILHSDGSKEVVSARYNAANGMIGSSSTRVSDDGLVSTLLLDNDADGLFDHKTVSTITLGADGSKNTTAQAFDQNLKPGGYGMALRSTIVATESDDGWFAEEVSDFDADGTNDKRVTKTVAPDGETKIVTIGYAENGSVASRHESTISGNKLISRNKSDVNGDGVFETTLTSTKVLNASGSSTTTDVRLNGNGSVVWKKISATSDDGSSTSVTEDFENNGVIDRTHSDYATLNANGSTTSVSTVKSANNSVIFFKTTNLSADKKVKTVETDADGNGLKDVLTVSTLDSAGVTTNSTQYFTSGGAVEGIVTETRSFDGQTTSALVDNNGDGRAELKSNTIMDFGEDGTVSTTKTIYNKQSVLIGRELSYLSDDGLLASTQVDLNGDGTFEFLSESASTFDFDGTITSVTMTKDAAGNLLFNSQKEVAANGLSTVESVDLNGDLIVDRLVETKSAADGATTTSTKYYYASGALAKSTVVSVSADRHTKTHITDANGNGEPDQKVVSTVAGNGDSENTYTEYDWNGIEKSVIVEKASSNGLNKTVEYDFNADGVVDLRKSSERSFSLDGTLITSYKEYHGLRLARSETRSETASGLSTTTTIDVDGNGTVDEVLLQQTVFNADGSKTRTNKKTYANGDLGSIEVEKTSRDGNTVENTFDRNGDGVIEKRTFVELRSDGGRIETFTTYDTAGKPLSLTAATTAPDRLTTKTIINGVSESVDRSAINNGSYVWDNGVQKSLTSTNATARHSYDNFGIDHWIYTLSTQVQESITYPGQPGTVYGPYTVYYAVDHVTSFKATLDEAAKADVIADAQSIVDSVLDRDLRADELEALPRHIENGQLNPHSFASSLIQSGEFSLRYGDLSNASFVNQIYVNALGRAPSLAELDEALVLFANPAQFAIPDVASARSYMVVKLTQSLEHNLIGNEHWSSNNNELSLSSAQSEHMTDRAEARELAARMVDTLYGREPTKYELDVIESNLMYGTASIDALSGAMRSVYGLVHDVGTYSLKGQTNADTVDIAFLNVFGHLPSAEDRQRWLGHIDAGRISVDQFLAALAVSVDHVQAGNQPGIWQPSAPLALDGGNGNDTVTATNVRSRLSGYDGNDALYGGVAADKLIGGDGADFLDGKTGNDVYVWSKFDDNDVISDSETSPWETDTLILTNVSSGEVALLRANSGNDLFIYVVPTGETIAVANRFYNNATGHGIEEIHFGDGVVWSLREIIQHTTLWQLSGTSPLFGSALSDNVYGGPGDDSINTGLGRDVIEAGLGNDAYNGGEDNDTYVWKKGHGNDIVYSSADPVPAMDTLLLPDTLQTEVQLSRANGSNDLKFRIAGVEALTVLNQYYGTTEGYGVERVVFSDGSSWSLSDIYRLTKVGGDNAANALSGTHLPDNLFGFAGADSLAGGAGDDALDGGSEADNLDGGTGSDTYVWRRSDGVDTLADTGTSWAELDRLVLIDVASTDVALGRPNGTDTLVVYVVSSGQYLYVSGQFSAAATGARGVEIIEFSDGVRWSFAEILDKTISIGTIAADQLSGTSYQDNFYALAGDDLVFGYSGDDVIVGGLGNDTLDGGIGSDLYLWSLTDGNDTINDTGTALSEVDTLLLQGVVSTQTALTKSGVNLIATIGTGSDARAISIVNRFYSSTTGYGIERIEFADGVVTEILASSVGEVITTGTAAGETLNGWAFQDVLSGLDGNDTLNGNQGDDRLVGGKGSDTLSGAGGSDSYQWSKGDGPDVINDSVVGIFDTDTLALADVAAGDFKLCRAQGSFDLRATILSTGETIVISNFFYYGWGIEAVSFSDGTTWDRHEIFANAVVEGSSTGDVLSGFNETADNFYGFGGDDVIYGYNGSDTLVGGLGTDSLQGGYGSDTYIWAKGDGADSVYDDGISTTEGDHLKLVDVASTDVSLVRLNGSYDGLLRVPSTNETLTLVNQFYTHYYEIRGYGVEYVEFSDGVVWGRQDIAQNMGVYGGSGDDYLNGAGQDENFYGGNGNDTIVGYAGNDRYVGGPGNDTLIDEFHADTYEWQKGDGNDTINDSCSLSYYTDILRLKDVVAADVSLRRAQGSYDLQITIGTTSEKITITNQFYTYYNVKYSYGIERIEFAGGTVWSLDDIIRNARVAGGAAADTLTGTGFDEYFLGGSGNDWIDGYYGDDILEGGQGADSLNGSEGIDVASYEGAGTGVTVNLILSTAQTGGVSEDQVGDVLINIEGLRGSAFADVLTGNAAANQMWGGAGNDTIYGGTGFDELFGEAGDDVLFGDGSSDSLLGGLGNDRLIGGSGLNDILDGGEGVDTADYQGSLSAVNVNLNTGLGDSGDAEGDFLRNVENILGSAFSDNLVGDSQVNNVQGGSGNDSIEGGAAADLLDGGDGIDTLSYSSALAAVNVNLLAGVSSGSDTLGDSFSNFENILGSQFGDTLTGNHGANLINGQDGNDVIGGHGGNDILIGGNGSDWFYANTGQDLFDGGSGVDTIYYYQSVDGVSINLATGAVSGGEAFDDTLISIENIYGSLLGSDVLRGNSEVNYLGGFGCDDQLYGGDGNDVLDGGLGGDLVDGGNGTDTAHYFRSMTGVTVDLSSGLVNGGDAQGDTLISIESVYGSDAGGDTLYGSSEANTLNSYKGNDYLEGRQGNDWLSGGEGSDTFLFALGFGQDIVQDFSAGLGAGDVLKLSMGVSFDTYSEVMAATTQVGANAVITFDSGTKITLFGVSKTALVVDDFAFI